VGILLVIGAALRVWEAVWDFGLVWPDEIFQTLEQAHRFAFGRGIIPWEFRDGARSWVYPGLLGLSLKAMAALGVTQPLTFLRLAKLGMAALSFGGVWAGMRLARHLGGRQAELLAALFGAVCPPLVIFSARCTTETASAPLIVLGALLLEVSPNKRRAALAGALVSLTVLFRYQNGIVAAGLLVLLLARRRWAQASSYLGTSMIVAALGAALDWKTWGSPFHPLVAYMKFTYAPGGPGHWGSRWGDAPFSFFSDHLGALVGPTFSVILLGLAVASRRARGLVIILVVFVIAHSTVPHKELRFMTPILELGVALASVGLADLFNGLHKGARPTYLVAALAGAQMLWLLRAPTLADMGYGTYGPTDHVVWHANEDYYRATLDAAEAPDLCGITYVDTARAWTGGYTFLHRDVPVFFDLDPHDMPSVNYVISLKEQRLPPTYRKVSEHGKFALSKRDGTCAPPPPDWTLYVL
jgi:GPI mannosyltransferase 3